MQKAKSNLLTVIKDQLFGVSRVTHSNRVVEGSSFRKLPAVRSFIVNSSIYNPVLAAFGINLRLPRTFKMTGDRKISGMNRYMAHVLLSIRKSVSTGNYKKAWKIIDFNIKHSNSFLLTSYNFSLRGWYYKRPVPLVKKELREIIKLLKSFSWKLKITRVYIEKANGKLRPLGVPTPSWRVVTHMYSSFILEMVRGLLISDQHAYIPGKGVLTAWRHIVLHVLHKKYIYETDLESFFPNVSIWSSLSELDEVGLPDHWLEWLLKLCSTVPRIAVAKMDESKYTNFKPKHIGDWKRVLDIKIPKIGRPDGSEPVEEYLRRAQAQITEYVGKTIENLAPGGFPQGLSLSPLLSILPLKNYLRPRIPSGDRRTVNYADDQWFYWDSIKRLVKSMWPRLKPQLLPEPSRSNEYNRNNFLGGSSRPTPNKMAEKIMSLTDRAPIITSALQKSSIDRNLLKGALTFCNKVLMLVDVYIDFNVPSSVVSQGMKQSEEKSGWAKKVVWVKESVKFLGLRYFWKEHTLKSDTRNGVKDSIPEIIMKMFSPEGRRLIKSLKSLRGVEKLANKLVFLKVDRRWLRNLVRTKFFGFVYSCLVIGDWTNDHKDRDQDKMIANFARSVKASSLIGREPKKTDSSKSVHSLLKMIKTIKKRSTFATKARIKRKKQ